MECLLDNFDVLASCNNWENTTIKKVLKFDTQKLQLNIINTYYYLKYREREHFSKKNMWKYPLIPISLLLGINLVREVKEMFYLHQS